MSIRSVEGRSGALQAISPKSRSAGRDRAQAVPKTKTQNTQKMLVRNVGRDTAQAVPKTATQAAQTSTAASRWAVGTPTAADMVARQAGRDKAQAVPKTETQYQQQQKVAADQNAAARAAVTTAVKAYQPVSRTTTSAPKTTTSSPSGTTTTSTSAPAPTTTTSTTSKGESGGKISEGSTVGGLKYSRSAQGAKTNRRNPRRSNSLTDQELRKLASRRFRG